MGTSSVKLLKRGENVNLSKQFSGQTRYKVGLSWDFVEGKKFDLDVTALCLTDKVENGGKAVSIDHLVGYMSNDPDRDNYKNITFDLPNGAGKGFKDPEGAIMHYGDNRDGKSSGDDETIEIDFTKINPKCKSILILVSIYDEDNKGYNFGQVKNSMVNLYEGTSDISSLAYELKEDYSGKSCLEFVEFYLHNNEWKLSALGDGNDNNFEEELKKFGIPVE